MDTQHITIYEDPYFSIFNITPLNILSLIHNIKIIKEDYDRYIVIGSFANIYTFLCAKYNDPDYFVILPTDS